MTVKRICRSLPTFALLDLLSNFVNILGLWEAMLTIATGEVENHQLRSFKVDIDVVPAVLTGDVPRHYYISERRG